MKERIALVHHRHDSAAHNDPAILGGNFDFPLAKRVRDRSDNITLLHHIPFGLKRSQKAPRWRAHPVAVRAQKRPRFWLGDPRSRQKPNLAQNAHDPGKPRPHGHLVKAHPLARLV